MSSAPNNKTNTSSPGLLRRLAALVYDTLLVFAVLMLITFVFVYFEAAQGPVYQSALLLTLFAFFTKFWRFGGQTLGMKSWDFKIVSADEKPITLMQCLLRFIAAAISIACFGLGYIWMVFDKDKLTWHDRYSETRLIMTEKRQKLFK